MPMAGVYIHIPFCKSRCRYCDFYSTTGLARREEYMVALRHELVLRSASFEQILHQTGHSITTIYFGGGTPSTICEKDIVDFINAIRITFEADDIEEITMEANPGDLTEEKLRILHDGGVNRLSIGIQSFNDTLLRRIGRRHTAEEAKAAIEMAKRAGFGNISIDLMYGLPGQTMEDWQKDVKTAMEQDIQHISAYCLTYEEGTPLYNALMAGDVEELDDELLNEMQDYLEAELQKSGIMRYEVSNYAIPGYESRHNGSYWTGAPYMGLGAGAHSYDGQLLRQWNPDDIDAYISEVKSCRLPLESEILTDTDRYNEAIMLGLRTVKGIDLASLKTTDREMILQKSSKYVAEELLSAESARLRATHAGMRVLNSIITELMKD